MSLLSEIFSWWGGNTWGTRFSRWRKGKLVGQDEFGNRYFVQKVGRRAARRAGALGHLSEALRGEPGAARLAWLAALYRRYAADRGALPSAPLAEAASDEPDRHAAGIPPERLDLGQRRARQVLQRL